jgi:RNA-directed DNA polymerase
MTDKLKRRDYAPMRPAGFLVPKAVSGTRTVSTFAVADEVMSGRLFRSLSDKNRSLFSSRAYAYRKDLTPHDALAHIRRELAREQRVFVAEFDFSKYFDTISHDHLWATIDSLGLIATPLERWLIGQFLSAPEPYLNLAAKLAPAAPRTSGLPQGTSISLLLANLAATPLDGALERVGVGFVRYADDTLIWSHSYERVCEAVDILHGASHDIGSKINVEKSAGVSLLVPDGTKFSEMKAVERVDYLGHSVGLRALQMKAPSVKKMKARISTLLFTNLLLEPLNGTQDLARISSSDPDYVTYIWQLRRYLYGPLSENQVRRFQRGGVLPMSFQGVMSFFPLVDDDEQLLEIDKWIAAQTWLALRKRAALLAPRIGLVPTPWGVDRRTLIGLKTKSRRTGAVLDLRIPSVRRIASVIRLTVATRGLGVAARGSGLYLYEDD